MIEADGAERERAIVETFVELSNATGDASDVVGLLHRLVVRSAQLLSCAEAGLLLHDGLGSLHAATTTSGVASQAMALLSAQREAGPSLDCLRSGLPVQVDDLADEAERWPALWRAAVASDIRSMQAVPMRVGGETVGVLNLFRADAGPFAARDACLAQGMADAAAAALTRGRALRRADDTVEQLQHALTSRVVIEQAKGVLAGRIGADVETAFALLRTYARTENRRLGEIAQIIVGGGLAANAVIDVITTRSVTPATSAPRLRA